MAIFGDKFKQVARAAAVVTALSATAFTALPAQAQSSFGFSFGTGNNHGPSFSFGIGNDDDHRGRCLSQRQLIREIRDEGYRNVRLSEYGRRWAEVRATRRGWVYELTVNSCTGRIVDRDRIRRS